MHVLDREQASCHSYFGGQVTRGRKPRAIPTVEWKLHIQADLAAEVELLLADPAREKAKYGARSELIHSLLRDWLYKQRIHRLVKDE